MRQDLFGGLNELTCNGSDFFMSFKDLWELYPQSEVIQGETFRTAVERQEGVACVGRKGGAYPFFVSPSDHVRTVKLWMPDFDVL